MGKTGEKLKHFAGESVSFKKMSLSMSYHDGSVFLKVSPPMDIDRGCSKFGTNN